jgi:SEC-C motif-containing protein
VKAVRKLCPCHSEVPYSSCCEPFHRGDALPERPSQLMRSRYSAFALGLAPYLVETLAATHPDRDAPRDRLVRELAGLKDVRRFMGLRVVGEWVGEGGPDHGQVLFVARLFERGKNVGFAELSTFAREGGRWRYAEGELVWLRAMSEADVRDLSRESLRALAARAAR